MRIEDREEFIDMVAQAVMDKIEERDRIEGMVGLVVARVLALQKEQTLAQAALAEALIDGAPTENLSPDSSSPERLSEETPHAEH